MTHDLRLREAQRACDGAIAIGLLGERFRAGIDDVRVRGPAAVRVGGEAGGSCVSMSLAGIQRRGDSAFVLRS